MRTFQHFWISFGTFLFVAPFVKSQELPLNSTTNKIEYEQIIEFPQKSRQELFSRIQDWGLENELGIVSMDSVNKNKIVFEKFLWLKYSDDDLFSTIGSKEYDIRYDIAVDFKDEKIRCRISNIVFLEYKSPSMTSIYVGHGYGVAASRMKEAQVFKYAAEDFYPIQKNEIKYQKVYKYFFSNIDSNIKDTFTGIKNYSPAISQDENW